MTVRVASTTDTEAQVKELAQTENADPPQSEFAPASEAVPDNATDDATVAEDTVVSSAEPDEEGDAEVEASDESPPAISSRRKRRRGRSYKDRASQLAREKADETERANKLSEELERLKKDLPAPTAAAVPVPVPEDPVGEEGASAQDATSESASGPAPSGDAKSAKPNQEDFDTYDEYQEAMVNWRVEEKVSQSLEKREAEQRERIARDQAQHDQKKVVDEHVARIDVFKKAHADFDAVIDKGKNLPLTRPMQDAVVNSDSGPALMYHLCQHPEECDRIAAMPPMMAVKEMGKLEARIEAASTGPASSADSLTQAPRPIKPVGGGATASTMPLDQMSYRDYKRIRDKEEATERGG